MRAWHGGGKIIYKRRGFAVIDPRHGPAHRGGAGLFDLDTR